MTSTSWNTPVTQNVAFACGECNKSFNRKANLARHWNIFHSGKKPFQCPMCGRSFSLQFQLKRHLDRRCLCNATTASTSHIYKPHVYNSQLLSVNNRNSLESSFVSNGLKSELAKESDLPVLDVNGATQSFNGLEPRSLPSPTNPMPQFDASLSESPVQEQEVETSLMVTNQHLSPSSETCDTSLPQSDRDQSRLANHSESSMMVNLLQLMTHQKPSCTQPEINSDREECHHFGLQIGAQLYRLPTHLRSLAKLKVQEALYMVEQTATVSGHHHNVPVNGAHY